jgi:hypothetical protein
MALQQEFWKKEIEGALYQDNMWLERSRNANEYVIGGVAVHVPNAASSGSVIRNPTYPLTVVQRADTEVIYTLDKYSTPAMLVAEMEEAELSYDKLQSVKEDLMGLLIEFTGLDMMQKWAANCTTAEVVSATGAVAPSTLVGATGNRKIITEADIRKAALMMDNMKMPSKGRVLVMQPDMVDQLMADNNLKYAFQQVVDLKEGALGRLHSFDIYKSPTALRRSAGGVVKVPEAATAIDDNVAGLFYHENQVERAVGNISLFENPKRAEYQGTLVSFNVRFGGRAVRTDRRGVGLLVSTP